MSPSPSDYSVEGRRSGWDVGASGGRTVLSCRVDGSPMLKLINRVLGLAVAVVVAGALFVTAVAVWSWWAPTESGASDVPRTDTRARVERPDATRRLPAEAPSPQVSPRP